MNTLLMRQQQLQSWINQNTEFECSQLALVSGDASFRRYFRFVSKGLSIIAVDAPPTVEDSNKFVHLAKRFAAAGVRVPEVYAHSAELGFYCQQDFGDKQFSEALVAEGLTEQSCATLYATALDLIPNIQTIRASDLGDLPLYDLPFVKRELTIFTEWLLAEYLQFDLSAGQAAMLKHTFACLTETFLAQPMVGIHRDFHSRNLMLLEQQTIGVIDFQDAVLGPITYDAVSLLRDCYHKWPASSVDDWLQTWHAKYYAEYDWQQFKRWFDFTGMQRHIKASGIFARLHLRDKKSVYLGDIPRTLEYLVAVGGRYPELSEFSEFIANHVLPMVKTQKKE